MKSDILGNFIWNLEHWAGVQVYDIMQKKSTKGDVHC